MPGTPQKRRYDLRGLLLGTWKHAGLDAVRANAVYGSCDKQNRINRRIPKESPTGQMASGGNFNNKKNRMRSRGHRLPSPVSRPSVSPDWRVQSLLALSRWLESMRGGRL